ncbi:MAG: hypothetical protein K0R25_867 [Rickettsiaceae bacterium]|jgi:general secretion pathway protein D|nr:hypothetical protein [Rickettsiaceae bacterium]
MSKISANAILKSALCVLILTNFFGCSQGKIDPLDINTGTTRSEARDTFFGNRPKKLQDESSALKSSSIPQSAKIIAIPSPPKANSDKLISFSVTDSVPLKDVLIELAKVAKLDLDLDPSINGGVVVNAKNRPLTEVLDRISSMGNLRYTLNNNLLHIEQDLPYAKNYLVDFLIDGNLWTEVEKNVAAIINGGGSGSSGGSTSSNKPSNIITVFTSQKNHKKVSAYIDEMRKNSSAQVLIEAKVVEVRLSNTYKTGIDWNWVGKSTSTIPKLGTSFLTGEDNPFTLGIASTRIFGGNITATIEALEKFGNVKTISSPRVSALNNQKAELNFTKKLVYFTYSVNSTTTPGVSGSNPLNNTVVNVTSNTVDTGIQLVITPTIDLVTNEVTMDVHPTLSSKSDVAKAPVYDPNAEPDSDGKIQPVAFNEIPIIDTRELKTIAKIQSGNILVIGGVMFEDTNNTDTGIPFLQRIPILGNLFKSTSKVSDVTEMAIFIKATVVNSGDGVSKFDRNLHDNFTSSSRPFFNSN